MDIEAYMTNGWTDGSAVLRDRVGLHFIPF